MSSSSTTLVDKIKDSIEYIKSGNMMLWVCIILLVVNTVLLMRISRTLKDDDMPGIGLLTVVGKHTHCMSDDDKDRPASMSYAEPYPVYEHPDHSKEPFTSLRDTLAAKQEK